MIPKIIHYVWIGPKLFPEQWAQTWRDKHPDWQFKVWGDHELRSRKWHNQTLMNTYLAERRYPGVADCMRYQILHEEGGFVPPADSVCLQPVDELFQDPRYTAYACYENEKVRPGLISPLYASAPGSNFARALIRGLPVRPGLAKDGRSRAPWLVTGNAFMRRMKAKQRDPKLLVWPSHYFTPVHFTGHRYVGPGPVYACQQWGSTDGRSYTWP